MKLVEAEQKLWKSRMDGNTEVTLNGKDFVTRDDPPRSLLTAKGMCSAAQRRSVEICGMDSTPFSCCAHATEDHLKGAGKQVDKLAPGVLIFFQLNSPTCSKCNKTVNHVALAAEKDKNGDWWTYENTSSGKRGTPLTAGFKKTALEDIDPAWGTGDSRMTGLYAMEKQLPAEHFEPGNIVVLINEPGDGSGAYLGYFDGVDTYLVTQKHFVKSLVKLRPAAEEAGCTPPKGIIVPHFAESPREVWVWGPYTPPATVLHWKR